MCLPVHSLPSSFLRAGFSILEWPILWNNRLICLLVPYSEEIRNAMSESHTQEHEDIRIRANRAFSNYIQSHTFHFFIMIITVLFKQCVLLPISYCMNALTSTLQRFFIKRIPTDPRELLAKEHNYQINPKHLRFDPKDLFSKLDITNVRVLDILPYFTRVEKQIAANYGSSFENHKRKLLKELPKYGGQRFNLLEALSEDSKRKYIQVGTLMRLLICYLQKREKEMTQGILQNKHIAFERELTSLFTTLLHAHDGCINHVLQNMNFQIIKMVTRLSTGGVIRYFFESKLWEYRKHLFREVMVSLYGKESRSTNEHSFFPELLFYFEKKLANILGIHSPALQAEGALEGYVFADRRDQEIIREFFARYKPINFLLKACLYDGKYITKVREWFYQEYPNYQTLDPIMNPHASSLYEEIKENPYKGDLDVFFKKEALLKMLEVMGLASRNFA